MTIKLGDILNIKTGKLDANAKVKGGVFPFFTCAKEQSQIDTYSYDCECVLVAGNGDLNVKYYEGKFDAYQRTYILESNGTFEIDMKFLYHFMSQHLERLRSQTIGGVIQYIKMGNLTNIDFPDYDLPTQKSIAKKLDHIQSLIDQKKEAIAKTEELGKSIFVEMFGDPVKNDKGFDVYKMIEVCNKITDGTHDTPERIDSGVPFITGKHIRAGIVDYENCDFVSELNHNEIFRRCNPELGDVLYTNIGVNLGTAAMNKVDYEFSMKNVALLKYDREQLAGEYLTSLLNHQNFKSSILNKAGIGGAQKFLSLTNIKDIKMPVPSKKSQMKFSELIDLNSRVIESHKESLLDLKDLLAQQMQESFSI